MCLCEEKKIVFVFVCLFVSLSKPTFVCILNPLYSVTESNSFEEGAKSCLNLAGLGKLSPNMMLVGFKADWVNNLLAAEQYFAVLQGAFDLNLAVGILR